MSPSLFNVSNTTANETVLNSDGNVNQWYNVTNSVGVRASFLLRLARANVLKLLVKADNEKKQLEIAIDSDWKQDYS